MDDTIRSNSSELSSTSSKQKSKGHWRDLTAYWILGMCNNYGYVVMLSAAHDILKKNFDDDNETTESTILDDTVRPCNSISTGAILLADILPALFIKVCAPFLPFHVHLRVLVAVVLQIGGFLLVSFAGHEWVAILGVVSTSLSSGLGEVTFLSYSSMYNKNVISTWSSGTGGAGIAGSVSYAGLTGLGMDASDALLVMLVVPVIEALTFWILLRHSQKPEENDTKTSSEVAEYAGSKANIISDRSKEKRPSIEVLLGFKNKLRSIPSLFKYMIPIGMVYLLEYFINQGLFELVYFENIWLNKDEQYRWLQVDYQIGVFISRSSVNLIQIRHIWLMSVFQMINVCLLTFEILYSYCTSIWIVFAIVLWEGLLGGGAYVNTFYRMSEEIPHERKEFAMGITTLADSLGIAIAGWIAIPTHNALCKLPKPVRL